MDGGARLAVASSRSSALLLFPQGWMWMPSGGQQHSGRGLDQRGSSGQARLLPDAPPALLLWSFPQGLPPTTNVRAVTADIRTAQRVAKEAGAGFDVTLDSPKDPGIKSQYAGVKGQALPAEVLYAFPGWVVAG